MNPKRRRGRVKRRGFARRTGASFLPPPKIIRRQVKQRWLSFIESIGIRFTPMSAAAATAPKTRRI